MIRRLIYSVFVLGVFSVPLFLKCQDSSGMYNSINLVDAPEKSSDNAKSKIVWTAHGMAYGVSLTGLYFSWYREYPFGKFRFVNDNRKWLQVDKMGHAWSGYIQGRLAIAGWRWTGMEDKKAVWKGTLTGFAFQNVVEVLDGLSAGWGFSWGDYIADIAGSSLLIGQELAWKEQRIQFKFSTHRIQYEEEILEQRADELYGESFAGRMLDDYNAQTYWFSVNPSSFIKNGRFPSWLNIAVGYGANGMFGETDNRWIHAGSIEYDRTDLKRTRQFYISPDIDLTKIKTKSKAIRTGLFLLNSFKFPAPALEFSDGRTKFHWFYF